MFRAGRRSLASLAWRFLYADADVHLLATPWERATAWRTFAFALAMLAVAWLVTAASDEGGVPWAARLARTLPAAPALAAVATALVAHRCRTRGELRALAALGVAPWPLARGAVAGGAAFSLVAASLAGLLPGAASAFFPRAPFGARFVAAGDGSFVDPVSGWIVHVDGALVHDRAALHDAVTSLPPGAPLAASLALAGAGLGLSLLAAAALSAGSPGRSGRAFRAAYAWRPALTVVAVLLAFQRAAATGRGAWLAAALTVAFIVDGAWSFRRATRSDIG